MDEGELEALLSISSDAYAHAASITHTIPDKCKRLQVHIWYRHGEKYYGKERNQKCWPKGGYPVEEPPEGCIGEGDLSTAGRARMRHLGNQLRSALIERDGFVSSDCAKDKEEVFLWVCKHANQTDSSSTTNQRHWESLREVCRGLWPEDNRTLESLNLQGPIKAHMEKDLYYFKLTDAEKVRIKELNTKWDESFESSSFSICKRNPVIAALMAEHVEAAVQKDPVHDTLMRMMCSGAHGVPLPAGVTMDDFKELSHADVQGWPTGNRCSDTEVGKLICGGMVSSVTDALARAAGDKPLLDVMCSPLVSACAGTTWEGPNNIPPKLFIWSASDGHLTPLAAALKIPYSEFARFGAYLMFELFERNDGKTLLRVTQDSKVLTNFVHLSADSDGLFSWPQCYEMLSRLS